MPDLINWDLLKQPLNWVIVVLMLAIGTFALCLLMQGQPVNPLGTLSVV